MVQTIIFDLDGVIIKRGEYWSESLSRDFNVPIEKITAFFQKEYLACAIGQADIKEEIQKYLAEWNWPGSADELLLYWFTHEEEIDEPLLKHVDQLRQQGFNCCLQTSNEKYRMEYMLDTVGLRSHFDAIFVSADLGCPKPSHEFWQAIYDKIGGEPKNTLIWDNEQKVVDAARDFGFRAELYTDFFSYQERMLLLVT